MCARRAAAARRRAKWGAAEAVSSCRAACGLGQDRVVPAARGRACRSLRRTDTLAAAELPTERVSTMSVLVRFSPESLTTDRYDEVKRRLNAAGHWPPDGLEYHVCFGTDGQLKVSEIWASNDQFEAFGQQLGPILEEVGINQAAPPELLDIHNQERF